VAKSNIREFREEWLQAATGQLRPYFLECGLEMPEKIRFAIAFPSTGRKGNRLGETWHSRSSGDGTYEIIIRSDLAEPVEVLAVLVNKLVHTVVPDDTSHGKRFRAVALKVGLSGKIHKAEPGPLLQKRLSEIADKLGPLPHAALNINDNPMTTKPLDRPKRDVGKPHCPKHGEMSIEEPAEEQPAGAENDDAAKVDAAE
jgi:hypothetical protein